MFQESSRINAPRRTVLSLAVLLLIVLIVWGMSSLLAYFHTGATWEVAAAYNEGTLLKNAPEAQWIKSVPEIGETPDPFLLGEIKKAYLEAWQALNYTFRHKNSAVWRDHFAESQWADLEELLAGQADYRVEQADLAHQLYLHTFSLDKQLVAFTDRGVKIKKKIEVRATPGSIYNDIQLADFEVVMTLDDGQWRVRHFQRKPYSEVTVAPAALDSVLVKVTGGQFLVQEQVFRPAGINYYPMNTPWFDFWLQFDTARINQDLAIIRELRLNTIRIFVFYDIFGGSKVREEMLQQLDQLLQLADDKQLKVVVTLFDFLPSYAIESYPSHEQHLKQLLTRFRDHPALLAWDLKNEPDLDFGNHGQETVLDWLEYMLSMARVYDPNHPTTIGWSSAQVSGYLRDQVDFLSFHFYEPLDSLVTQLEALEGLAGGKPVMISEFGLSTFNSLFLPGGHSEAEQATHYRKVLDTIGDFPAVSFLSWTLYDFPDLPGEVFSGSFWQKLPQKHYGIIRTDGRPKPAAAVLSTWQKEE